MDLPARKHLLLSYKQLKQESKSMPLKYLLKCKLGLLRKPRQGNEIFMISRMLVEKYHLNIGNVS